MELIQRVVKENLPVSEEVLQTDDMDKLDLLSSIVLKFHSKASSETIDWLVELIKAPGRQGSR